MSLRVSVESEEIQIRINKIKKEKQKKKRCFLTILIDSRLSDGFQLLHVGALKESVQAHVANLLHELQINLVLSVNFFRQWL